LARIDTQRRAITKLKPIRFEGKSLEKIGVKQPDDLALDFTFCQRKFVNFKPVVALRAL